MATTYAKSTVTIAKIFDAARALFVDKNYNDVTMSEIANAAGVTKGALYHHFDSKDDLYLKMMHDYLEGIESLIRNAIDGAGSSRDRMRQLALSFLKLSVGEQNLMKLVRRDINIFRDPARDSLIRAYQKALPDKVEEVVRDGIRDGEITQGDARVLAWEHVAMVEVVLGPYPRSVLGGPEATADYVTRLFFDGAAKRDLQVEEQK